jgi:coproporphyrinogen III oxidase-like Fe-S oxidoreductase
MGRASGILNINLDFVYGLPCRRLTIGGRRLNALALKPEHLSLRAEG